MNSKILIDWNDGPMVTVKLPVDRSSPTSVVNSSVEVDYDDLDDVRDKLLHTFIKSGPFAMIAGTDVGRYEIHSMGVFDLMRNIMDLYGDRAPSSDVEVDFYRTSGRFVRLLADIDGVDLRDFDSVKNVLIEGEDLSQDDQDEVVGRGYSSPNDECASHGAKYGFGDLKNNYTGA